MVKCHSSSSMKITFSKECIFEDWSDDPAVPSCSSVLQSLVKWSLQTAPFYYKCWNGCKRSYSLPCSRLSGSKGGNHPHLCRKWTWPWSNQWLPGHTAARCNLCFSLPQTNISSFSLQCGIHPTSWEPGPGRKGPFSLIQLISFWKRDLRAGKPNGALQLLTCPCWKQKRQVRWVSPGAAVCRAQAWSELKHLWC